MTKQVKIIKFRLDAHDTRQAEKELSELVELGWVIITAGGGGGGSADEAGPWGVIVETGFVNLVKDA